MSIEYWCDNCGTEPKIKTGNKINYCPCCGKYGSLHNRRKSKWVISYNDEDDSDYIKLDVEQIRRDAGKRLE